MLKSFRYSAFFTVVRERALAPRADGGRRSSSAPGPSRINDRKSTAYETDIVDPLRDSGKFTLRAEVTEERSSSVANHVGCGRGSTGKKRTSRNTPLAMTAPT